jgi:hypothetical protein
MTATTSVRRSLDAWITVAHGRAGVLWIQHDPRLRADLSRSHEVQVVADHTPTHAPRLRLRQRCHPVALGQRHRLHVGQHALAQQSLREVGTVAQALGAAGECGEHLGQRMRVEGVAPLQQQCATGVVMRLGLVGEAVSQFER